MLLLAIDQLRPDRLSPSQPGGLGRLQREGRVFVAAELAHAFTETCPGHATMLTGRHPGALGVPGNRYVDPETLDLRYCVDDPAEDAAVLGVAADPNAGGRSPRNLRAGGLGDWMKQQRPATRVFSVSAKDRAAITLGGARPDAAYWLDRSGPPRFTTSRYYLPSLPTWAAAWGPDRVLANLPDSWHYGAASIERAKTLARPDDYPAESPQFRRASPHPLLRGVGAEAAEHSDEQQSKLPTPPKQIGQRLYASPFLDKVTLAFARDLVVREQLGDGPETDLLAVSLSATDVVGHVYGPGSWESLDALARLDEMLADFLDFLEARVGAGRLLVVLTSDHGVLPVPEWLLETNESACPLPGGRLHPSAVLEAVTTRLDRQFGPDPASVARPWFVRAGTRLTLNRERVHEQELPLQAVLTYAVELLEDQPGIAKVWRAQEIEQEIEKDAEKDFEKDVEKSRGPSALARLYANSWDLERAGDLALQVSRDCLLSTYPFGTSHGSPYGYDRDIPLIFYGAGIEPGRVDGAAATVDIAPTLAHLLGVDPPRALDGRILPLR